MGIQRRLSHFSAEPFELDRSMNYLGKYNRLKHPYKPDGLWLSDELDYGWKKWCEGEEFRVEYLKVETFFILDLTHILFLDSDKKIRLFNDKYSVPLFPEGPGYGLKMETIDWKKVAEKYKGILISPYSWALRMEYMWYYGYDCASACVWDLSAIMKEEKR